MDPSPDDLRAALIAKLRGWPAATGEQDPAASAAQPQPQMQPQGLPRQRALGLVMGLIGGNQGKSASELLMGNANQQQQYQEIQRPQAQLQQARTAQELQQAGPQASLGGETPSTYELLTKRAAVQKVAEGMSGQLYDVHTGKTVSGGGGGITLSPQALDQAAQMFQATGQLPPMGMGKSGVLVRRQILNHVAEMFPDANLAANKAGYKADTGSLATQQKILDNAESWERTGRANLNVLLGIGQRLSNTGSPWLNQPVRAFMEKAIGDPDMTAFRAAHATVVNEYAKILSGAQGSGSVTEGARHEAESMLPLDATPEQLVAAAKVLDTDAGNRIGAARQQVGQIRGRIGGQQATPTPTPTPAAAPQAVRRFTRVNGKLVEVK